MPLLWIMLNVFFSSQPQRKNDCHSGVRLLGFPDDLNDFSYDLLLWYIANFVSQSIIAIVYCIHIYIIPWYCAEMQVVRISVIYTSSKFSILQHGI